MWYQTTWCHITEDGNVLHHDWDSEISLCTTCFCMYFFTTDSIFILKWDIPLLWTKYPWKIVTCDVFVSKDGVYTSAPPYPFLWSLACVLISYSCYIWSFFNLISPSLPWSSSFPCFLHSFLSLSFWHSFNTLTFCMSI